AKYLSSIGSRHSRTVSVGSIRSAATTTMSRIRWRRSTETKRSNFGRKITSRYSSSTRLREDKPVGWIDGAQQGSLGEAVCFEGSGDEGRSVDDDDQAPRTARHSSSSASIFINQAVRARFALGLGDRLGKDIPGAPAFQQTAQVATDRFAPGWTLERLGSLGIDRDHHVNGVVHASLPDRACNRLS